MATPTIVGTPVSAAKSSSATWTQSITVPSTGSNRALIVLIAYDGGNASPTVATWNTTETLSVLHHYTATQQAHADILYLANPTATTANISLTFLGASVGAIIAATYQDMAQSSPTDVTDASNTGSGTSVTKSVTTTVDSDIIISWFAVGNGATGLTASNSQSIIGSEADTTDFKVLASDLPLATAGSQSIGYSWTGTNSGEQYIAALKYAAAPSGPTNVKTWDGVTQSTGIKTYKGVALASVKSVDGVT